MLQVNARLYTILQLESGILEEGNVGSLCHEDQIKQPKNDDDNGHNGRHPLNGIAFQLVTNKDCSQSESDVGEDEGYSTLVKYT